MKNYNIPVIIIHKGDSKYLPASLLQLRHTNPDTTVYFLGDAQNKKYDALALHYEISDFFETAREFEKIYIHLSTNGYPFELICLQRWFVLKDFMKRINIQQCIYLDSDVLVYADMNDLQKNLQSSAMTVSGISAHTNFVNSIDVLEDFCRFIWQKYEHEKESGALRRRYEAFLKDHPAGGISDMTFFTDYRKAHPDQIADLSVPADHGVFDITLDTVQGYESEYGFKKIVWKKKVPYAKHLVSNRYTRFNTLHFQGRCKSKIYKFVTYPFFDKMRSFLWMVHYYQTKIARKLLQ